MSDKTRSLAVSGMSGTIAGELKIDLIHQRPRWRRWRDWLQKRSLVLTRAGLLELLLELVKPGAAYRTKADTP